MNDFSENSPTGNVIDPMSAAMLAAKNGKDRPTADQYAANGQLVPESLRMLHDVITAATAYESEADQIDPGAVKDILDAGRITPEEVDNDDCDEVPILYAGSKESPMMTLQNFSVIIGVPGTRKTFGCLLLVAEYLSACTRPRSNYFIRADVEPGRVLWIDTEQGRGRARRIKRRMRRILDSDAAVLEVFDLREIDPPKRLMACALAIEQYRPSLVVIDGIADLCNDPNHIVEGAIIQQFVMKFSSHYNCHILTVIHANLNDVMSGGKVLRPRGHAGSNLYRKTETAMVFNADGEITKVSFEKARGKRPEDFCFKVNDQGLPEVVGAPQQDDGPSMRQQIRYDAIANYCRKFPNGCRYADLIKEIKRAFDKGDRTAKEDIKHTMEAGLIVKRDNGLYCAADGEAT